jgi:hypothetical protein
MSNLTIIARGSPGKIHFTPRSVVVTSHPTLQHGLVAEYRGLAMARVEKGGNDGCH